MKLKIGDRVRVISDPKFIKLTGEDSIIGMTGTVKELNKVHANVEFDDYGENGNCWYVPYDYLEKIEDTEDETKAETKEETKEETMEQKILTVLREEIGVEVGEEFYVYENGRKQWTCKFEENGFYRKVNDEFQESGLWKSIVGDFGGYRFKRKPFVPEYGEDYFFLAVEYDEIKSITFRALQSTWIDSSIDYGMLVLGNVFKTEEEALTGKDRLLERLEELRNGE